MSRWIRQEDVTATIGNMYERCDNDIVDYRELLLQCVEDLYDIEIVTCGECKYYIDNTCDCYSLYGDLSGDLIGVSFEPNEDFFCSYGERKVSEIPTGSERSSE